MNSDVKNEVEALLFSSGRAMNVDELANLIECEKKDVKTALKVLKEDYNSRDTSIILIQEGDSWKLNVGEQYVYLVTKIVADTELTRAMLETLSVIAWKAPVLQSEVIKIRSAQAYDHIKELVESGFIRKEPEGRSYILKLAEKFYEYFDVPDETRKKEMFKDVKMPEKIGELEVVDVPVSEKDESLNENQEIVDETMKISEGDEKSSEIIKESVLPVDHEFLDKINKQIDEISSKNDDLDNDELFKRTKLDEDEGLLSDTNSDSNQDNQEQESDYPETKVFAQEELKQDNSFSKEGSSESGDSDKEQKED